MFRNQNLHTATSTESCGSSQQQKMVSFALNEQRSPCRFTMWQPTARGSSCLNTPSSQTDRPHLPFWKLLSCQADYLGQCVCLGLANPTPSGGGEFPDWLTQTHRLLLPLAWPGAVGSPSDEGRHYACVRKIYLDCGGFFPRFLLTIATTH